MNKYVLDKDFNLKKVTRSVWGILWTCLKWIVATVSLAAFSYLIFSFVLNTEEEKRLKQENRRSNRGYDICSAEIHHARTVGSRPRAGSCAGSVQQLEMAAVGFP